MRTVYFLLTPQPVNLAKLTEQFIWRTAIDMQREHNADERGDSMTLKVEAKHSYHFLRSLF
jgi:hypothetical protein